VIAVVGNNADNFSALWATTLKILPTTRNNYYSADYYLKNLNLTVSNKGTVNSK
jgi:hypothetical protein